MSANPEDVEGGKVEISQEVSNAMRTLTNIDTQYYNATKELQYQSSLHQRSLLTCAELNELPQDIKVFRTVGRMFIRDNLDDMKAEVSNIVVSAAEEQGKLQKTLETLQKHRAELDKNLKELTKAL
uniref:Prefoldin subunit 1 n=1 Tax=Lygus hesperus TaxID=30085 RepID=A0A146KP53_LYGHE